MNKILIGLAFLFTCLGGRAGDYNKPIVDEEVVFQEMDGIVAVEAEFFFNQSKNEIRQWYRTSKKETPDAGRDDETANTIYLTLLHLTSNTLLYLTFGRYCEFLYIRIIQA